MKKVNTSDFAKQIRIESLKMVYSAKASHIGGALSMADILAVLYNEILSYDANPAGQKRIVSFYQRTCLVIYMLHWR